jgi:hypothetical protein
LPRAWPNPFQFLAEQVAASVIEVTTKCLINHGPETDTSVQLRALPIDIHSSGKPRFVVT